MQACIVINCSSVVAGFACLSKADLLYIPRTGSHKSDSNVEVALRICWKHTYGDDCCNTSVTTNIGLIISCHKKCLAITCYIPNAVQEIT
jgi:hypothetical protein